MNEPERNSVESNTHSFIIKLWIDEPTSASERAAWHGHMTHVPSGNRQYLQTIDDILKFIEPYMQAMGVEVVKRSWLRRWLLRLKG